MSCAKHYDCSMTIAASINYRLIVKPQKRELQQLMLGLLLVLRRVLLL